MLPKHEWQVCAPNQRATGDRPQMYIYSSKVILSALLINVCLCLCNVSIQMAAFNTLNTLADTDKFSNMTTADTIKCTNAIDFIYCQDTLHTQIYGSLNFPYNLTAHIIPNDALCEIESFLTNANATLNDRAYYRSAFSAYFYYGTVSNCQFTDHTRRPKMRLDCNNFRMLSHHTCSLAVLQ